MQSSGSKKVLEYGSEMFGDGPLLLQWSQDYNNFAVVGVNRTIHIFDKRGKKKVETGMNSKLKIMAIEWDKDSEVLAIMVESSNLIYLWKVFSEPKPVEFEVDPKLKASFIKWSPINPVLAIGADKGHIFFYNRISNKKVPTFGKHGKRVITGDWNREGLLVTGSEDKVITVSNLDSETEYDLISIKAEPRNLRWVAVQNEVESSKTVVGTLLQKSLLLYRVDSNVQPLELMFESKYGKIINYSLSDDGTIVIAFTEEDEISSEQVFMTTIDAICSNSLLNKVAVAGEQQVKIYSMATWKEVRAELIEMPKVAGKVSQVNWSNNGQLLLAATLKGQLYGFLTTIPVLSSEYGPLIATLTSFSEVTIMETPNPNLATPSILNTISIETEPNVIGLGPSVMAAGINNVLSFYLWAVDNVVTKGGKFIGKQEYPGSVKKVFVNRKWVAVMLEKKLALHPLELGTKPLRIFPESEGAKHIIHAGLSESFLLMLDAGGKIKIFSLFDETMIMDFDSSLPLMRIFPCSNGTKIVCLDTHGNGYFFIPASETMIAIQGFPSKSEKIVWDNIDNTFFVVLEADKVYAYKYHRNSMHGTYVTFVPELLSIKDLSKPLTAILTNLDKGLKPISLKNGFLVCLGTNNVMTGQFLASHSYLSSWKKESDVIEGHYRYFLQSLALGNYSHSLMAAKYLNDHALFDIFGRKCLEELEMEVAMKAFQYSGNLSMVLTIQSLMNESEKKLLMANIAMILGQYDLAQDLFLQSSNPQMALELRCDVQDWLVALNLAKNIAPEQEPIICRRLAAQIESQGNHNESLRLYERALLKEGSSFLPKSITDTHNALCYAGIAKTSIKVGDITRGFNIAMSLRDIQSIIEIAMVCENMKQFYEAAQLYERGNLPEKAASLYISLKMFKQADHLISKIKSPKLLIQLAKSKEAESAFKEAEAAYEKAEDWENVIRLNVNNLDNIEKAKRVLKEKCQTATCASIIAAYCQKKGTKKEAIEYLVLAEKKDEAFNLAITHGEMETYAKSLQNPKPEEFLRIAQYYEGKSMWGLAGRYYQEASDFKKAIKLYFRTGEEFINEAIEMCGKTRDEDMIGLMIDFLIGDSDGIPKDPKYTYLLYMKLGNLKQAAKIAVSIAATEQEQGNYKQAHTILQETLIDFRKSKLQVPFGLYQRLMIIHSYLLVRRVIKMGLDDEATFLLDRVCKNLSQFEAHAVNILTSAVIEATRANLKYLSFRWACVLAQPEYLAQVTDKYLARIRKIASKPVKNDEDYIKKSPCPFCRELVSDYVFDCEKCMNNIPFCIASGKHIISQDCYFCPKCQCPAIATSLKKFLETEPNCPLCGVDLESTSVSPMPNDQAVVKLKGIKIDIAAEEEKEEEGKVDSQEK